MSKQTSVGQAAFLASRVIANVRTLVYPSATIENILAIALDEAEARGREKADDACQKAIAQASEVCVEQARETVRTQAIRECVAALDGFTVALGHDHIRERCRYILRKLLDATGKES